jgi:hypothetical protein
MSGERHRRRLSAAPPPNTGKNSGIRIMQSKSSKTYAEGTAEERRMQVDRSSYGEKAESVISGRRSSAHPTCR